MTLKSKLLQHAQNANLNLAKVGGHMVGQGQQAAKVVSQSTAVKSGLRAVASNFPVKDLAVMCGRAGAAGAIVDGATGGFQALRAMKEGKIDGKQAAIHAGAEAGCGFVTSAAGTAGTLAAYMVTGGMGPLAIAAGMGASMGSRHIYRLVVGETLPKTKE